MSKHEKRESKTKKKSNFHESLKDKEDAFVLFYATWCPFSQEFLPVFEEYSRSNPEECLSVIVDEEPELCEEYDIEYYPTVILFKNGKVHERLDPEPHVGLSKRQFKEFTKKK